MSDHEIRDAREWDAASSQVSSRHSEGADDGFTTVQSSKAKRFNQRRGGPPVKSAENRLPTPQAPNHTARHTLPNRLASTRGGTRHGQGGAKGHVNSDHHSIRGNVTRPVPGLTRASAQLPKPTNAAQLERQNGHQATATYRFSVPRKTCNIRLSQQSRSLRLELGAIGRHTATHITESSADPYSVLIWGSDSNARQAVLQLEELSRKMQVEQWAKNPAYDGRREDRLEQTAHEQEQVKRLQLFADSQEIPFEYSFVWPDIELDLQTMIDTHDRPRGAFDSVRSDYHCSIRFDIANSIVTIQGMQEQDVVRAGRTFAGIALQMIVEMADVIKISLLRGPSTSLHQPFVSMDKTVELKTSLYNLPDPHGNKRDIFVVKAPKLWTLQLPSDEIARAKTTRLAKRLDRFNRKTLVAGLERRLTNLHFVNKAVRMQVNFGELGFLMYSAPKPGAPPHSFESFRQTMAKERTKVLLQAMPAQLNVSSIINYICQHPAFKHGEEPSASFNETFVVAFDFRRPDNDMILHHEQEFFESSKKDEMEVRRKTWVKIQRDSHSTSPLVLSMLDFEKLDWQLRVEAHDILDPRHMAKEYTEFESGVGVTPTPSPAGITGTPRLRATWPRGYNGLVRVTNKPVAQFTLGKTDHVLEIAREDVYDIDSFQSSSPQPVSKLTACFYHSKWVNHLGEFAYLKHGERPSWEAALSTFFPEEEGPSAKSSEKPKAPKNFLKEVEQVKQILWEAIRFARGDLIEINNSASTRLGVIDDKHPDD